MEKICAKAIDMSGGPAALAAKITDITGKAITSQAISQWKEIPPGRVLVVEKITGLSRHDLRPDVFGPQKETAQ